MEPWQISVEISEDHGPVGLRQWLKLNDVKE